jgi:aldehyde:ferredoxin oxidoreductase
MHRYTVSGSTVQSDTSRMPPGLTRHGETGYCSFDLWALNREERMTKGYNGSILHIDLSTSTSRVETMDETWYRTYGGGGLLGAWFLLRDTPPGIDPFDERNLLIFASSVIAGNDAPGLARFSVICKSPQSGGVAETRGEGPFGTWLKGSGYDAVVFHGAAPEPTVVSLEHLRVSFHPAAELWGTTTAHTTAALERQLGGDDGSTVQVAAIGPAGENLVRFASIVTSYSIQAARMGVGAVMGSKKLKALALCGCALPPVHDPGELAALRSEFEDGMRANTLSMWQKDPPGFSAAADLSDFDTAYIGYHNYRSNLRLENSNYTRAKYMEYYRGHIACPGCPNDCIKVIDPRVGDHPLSPEGHPLSAGIHQEATGALGPNVGNPNLKLMLEANVMCNELGMDPVSLGFTMSFAMECYEQGLLDDGRTGGRSLRFGDEAGVKPLIEDIAYRRGLGDTLAEGSRRAAEQLGGDATEYALHVKGVEMVSFEPRTQTGLALGYATAPIGPRYDICEHDWDFDVVTGWDHTLEQSRTLGILERLPMEHLGPDKVRNYKVLNTIWSACDALNLCVFASAPTRVLSLTMIPRLIAALTGWHTSSYEFMRLGERRNHLMRVYNLREGLGAADDTLPVRFFTLPIDHGRLAGTVIDRDHFDAAIRMYYEMMGWDASGVPREATLHEHQLGWAIPHLNGVP